MYKYPPGFKVDPEGNLTFDIYNPFGFTESQDSVVIGDEDQTEAVSIPKTIEISQDSVIL